MEHRFAATMTMFLICAGAWGAELPVLPNPSFESGSTAPDGWTGARGSEWAQGDARHGARSLAGAGGWPSQAWTSAPVPVRAGHGYIVEGWIKAPDAVGRIEVILRDDAHKELARLRSPRVQESADWRYVAVDTTAVLDKAPTVASLEVAFSVKGGRALLDDVHITPQSPPLMANADLDAPVDAKNRIPYWNAEKDDATLPGKREGTLTLDPTAPHAGKTSVAVAVTGDWFGVTSVAYGVLPWSDRMEFRAMGRVEPGTRAQALAVWLDSAGQVIRIDQGDLTEPKEWQLVSTGNLTPPENAGSVRPVFVARKKEGPGGKAWFDDAELIAVPESRIVKVLVNQAGYDIGAPKTATVATNFFPQGKTKAHLDLIAPDGSAKSFDLLPVGRVYGENGADWGWYFWRADFTPFDTEGKCQARAHIDETEAVSYPFAIGKDQIFRTTAPLGVDFFFVQRCGFEVPGWHAACHLDDAKMLDGAHRDLTGGWHSAGDYNKILYEHGDGGAMYALIDAFEAAPEFMSQFDRDKDGVPDALDEAWWGAKFMVKAQALDNGGVIGDIQQGPDRKTWMNWVVPEKMTDNVVGTADDPIVIKEEGNSPLAIGGWARLGKQLESRGIANDFLSHAVKLWDRATVHGTSAASPYLLISTIDLYRATNEDRYIACARKGVEAMLVGDPNGPIAGGMANTGDLPAAAVAYYALRFPDDPLAATVKARLQKHVAYMAAEPDNAFGISRQKTGPEGYFFEPTSTLGHNMEFFAHAWGGLMIYRVLRDDAARRYALDQINFVLGENPYNLCMMEGAGTQNPPRYHHRYNAIPGKERGAVPGAIPNGFVRDMAAQDRPGFDLSTGGRQAPSYRTSEPWLVHNILAMLAFTALHETEK